jgi:TonB family protein
MPNAIAAMAPPTDRRTTAGLSLLSYGALGLAFTLVAAVHPKVAPTKQVTTSFKLKEYVEPVQASLQPVAKPTGGGALRIEGQPAVVEPVKAETATIPDMPVGTSEKDRAEEGLLRAGTDGPGTVRTDLPPSLTPSLSTTNNSAPVELAMAQVRILHAVNPTYPTTARLIRAQGPVELRMTIDAQGTPTDVQVVSGHPVFHAEALRAARLWRFAPAEVGGRAVPASFKLTIQFRLQ